MLKPLKKVKSKNKISSTQMLIALAIKEEKNLKILPSNLRQIADAIVYRV